jgi:hypothetical protein
VDAPPQRIDGGTYPVIEEAEEVVELGRIRPGGQRVEHLDRGH